MIERKQDSEALIVGENNQREFGVHIKDLRQITKIMIDQYSQIKESVVRELVSNIYDSGSEGDTHLVGIHDNYIYFQDQGESMSKDFMLNTYTILGESTKRNDNTKIGAKGIGN